MTRQVAVTVGRLQCLLAGGLTHIMVADMVLILARSFAPQICRLWVGVYVSRNGSNNQGSGCTRRLHIRVAIAVPLVYGVAADAEAQPTC